MSRDTYELRGAIVAALTDDALTDYTVKRIAAVILNTSRPLQHPAAIARIRARLADDHPAAAARIRARLADNHTPAPDQETP